ncbi:hypothetical protein pdam_00025719 [Pocillopora damicornis]|uniref:Uncharacterized protein n=1 Tax=Pocillopora damicornis TaxID=46731 RepID=A0A3M6UPE7_POCDA|nr:hypothetical protein pdam_00025719 [Pocillopora damicornis]
MIREGTGKEITRENRRNPHIRNTTEINTGGTGAVPPGPRKARRRRMEIPPNVNSATGIEKVPERRKTLTRRVRWVRTETVNRPIKNRVEIATKDGRNRRIHLHMKIIEKLVPCRVAIRRINTTHTKRFTTKHEFTLEITANAITPRIDQRQRRPKKNNTATRILKQQGYYQYNYHYDKTDPQGQGQAHYPPCPQQDNQNRPPQRPAHREGTGKQLPCQKHRHDGSTHLNGDPLPYK